jgi:uncharacterized protein YbjT (DUF2867 family)
LPAHPETFLALRTISNRKCYDPFAAVLAPAYLFGHALLPDLKLPMIATRDVGDYAAQRLLDLDFSGKETREVLGERDLSMTEVTAAIARGIGKPDLRYEQFSYDQVRQGLVQMGWSPKKAAVYIEMFEAINGGLLVAQEPRSRQNSTPTQLKDLWRIFLCPRITRRLTALRFNPPERNQ